MLAGSLVVQFQFLQSSFQCVCDRQKHWVSRWVTGDWSVCFKEGNSKSNNHRTQQVEVFRRASLKAKHVKSCRSPHQVPLLSANNRKLYNSTRLTKQKIIILDFFGVNNLEAWIHPTLHQQFRLGTL